MLLGLASDAPAHDCCKHPGKQPTNSQNDCPSLALQHFVKADPAPNAHLEAVAYARAAAAGTQPVALAAPGVAIVVIPHSTPDLEVLNSNIRI
jgi:hypothetical protein